MRSFFGFIRSFPLLSSILVLSLTACGDDDSPGSDAAIDGDADADAMLPEGEAGEILSVPETGRFTIPELGAPAQVVFTEVGVPHIYAANERDMYLAMCFMMARDRYTEFELGRRLALGELSGLLGDAVLASDLQTRGQGMRFVAERIADQLTEEQRGELDACADGVNAYTRAVRNLELPPPDEIRLVSLFAGVNGPADLMEEIDGVDVLGFVGTIVFQLGFETTDVLRATIDGRLDELFPTGALADLRRAGVRDDIWERTDPIHDIGSAPGFGLAGAPLAPADFRPPRPAPSYLAPRPRTAPAPNPVMLERLVGRSRRMEDLLRGGFDADFGSNVWAVTGGRTADGSTLLAGDGHLPISVPTYFYRMGVDTRVFGDGDLTLLGLFFPGVPLLAVGTNGQVAWSQTYQRADVTDFYVEELRLDAAGAPEASLFRGSFEPLIAVEERFEIAELPPPLASVGRTETFTRYTTFDGRWLSAVEGRVVEADTVAGPGETVINVQGTYLIPGDEDGDGRVSAVSFDFTGFDVSNLLTTVRGWARSGSVSEFREHSRRMVTYAQNLGVADQAGNVLYTGYHAMPCRSHLARNPDGTWADGADPRLLIDGTQYGGFEIPLTAEGLPDETAPEPERCIIPFDRWPSNLNPDSGYILNANNDIASVSFDGSLTDDEYYLGGPWVPGQRALSIDEGLATQVAAGSANEASMAELQADHRSRVGEKLVPFLLSAIDRAQDLAAMAGPLPDDEQRLLDQYSPEAAAIDEVEQRLRDWITAGAQAESGVETFYHSPTPEDVTAAAATMIFVQWFREFFRGVFEDEGVDFLFEPDPRVLRIGALIHLVDGRGAENPEGLSSFNPATEESAFFDIVSTPEVERSEEIALAALVAALEALRAPPGAPGIGGFGTSDMSAWRWGLRHQLKLESILADFTDFAPEIELIASDFAIDTSVLPLLDDLDPADPRADLPWFPRRGDLNAVDAANPSLVDGDYFYGSGPVMRMVIALRDGRVSGRNVIPAGQSGLTDGAHFSDQARLWLGNETTPMRFHVDQVVEGAVGREVLSPE
ncbi:MAG: penicillin acylase family protein [Myxococcota bacterium]